MYAIKIIYIYIYIKFIRLTDILIEKYLLVRHEKPKNALSLKILCITVRRIKEYE